MVQPPTDDAEGDGVRRHVDRLARRAAAGGEPPARQPHRDEDAEQDAQGVGADQQRTDVERAHGGARDRCGDGEPDGGRREQGAQHAYFVAAVTAWVKVSGVPMFARFCSFPPMNTVGVPVTPASALFFSTAAR